MPVAVNLAVALVCWIGGFALFGRFVAPRWKVAGKAVFYLLVSAALSAWVGWWALVFVIGHPALGIAGHVWWCRRHGVHWMTCEPRDRYLALRPWAAHDGFAPDQHP